MLKEESLSHCESNYPLNTFDSANTTRASSEHLSVG